jgi:G3E family GTPase
MRSPAELFGNNPFGRRLSRPGAGKVPVSVVTGFLGAGKTTLIRAALAHPDAANTVVIVNEFGEIGIDDVLLRTSTEEVVLIGNGCMCCSSRNDLQRSLRNLFAERENGAIPPFERVIVETSGLSDPGPILQSFHSDRTIALHYAMSGLVTVVDAALADRAQDETIWTEQVIQADTIILTKGDIAGPERLAAIKQELVAINPQAALIDAETARSQPRSFLDTPVLREKAHDHDHDHHHHDHGGDHHGHDHARDAAADYDSFVLSFDKPFDWALFVRTMDALVAQRGEDLLRVKGLLNVAGSTGPVVVHYVRHLSSPPEELMNWPSADRRSRLVFITRRLARARIEALFNALLALAEPV